MKFFRNKKLSSFTEKVLYNFKFSGISFKIWLNPENGFVDQEIFTAGVYEPEVLMMYKEYLKPGQTYVDIGANIGQHALYAAALVGSFGKVVAYDTSEKEMKKELDTINNFKKLDYIYRGGNIADVGVIQTPDGRFATQNSDGTYTILK